MSEAAVLEFSLVSDPAELPAVRERMRKWTAAQGWTEDQIADLVLAVDEALTNVIRHGYEGACDQRIDFAAQVVRDTARGEGLEICVRDYGKQVDPERICGRDLNDLRPGGLGVHIIRSMMDEAEYSQVAGGGMRLIMRKYKSTEPHPGRSRARKP